MATTWRKCEWGKSIDTVVLTVFMTNEVENDICKKIPIMYINCTVMSFLETSTYKKEARNIFQAFHCCEESRTCSILFMIKLTNYQNIYSSPFH